MVDLTYICLTTSIYMVLSNDDIDVGKTMVSICLQLDTAV